MVLILVRYQAGKSFNSKLDKEGAGADSVTPEAYAEVKSAFLSLYWLDNTDLIIESTPTKP